MKMSNAQYANAEHTEINALVDGSPATFDADDSNRHYRELVDQGVTVTAYAPPAVTVEDLKAHTLQKREEFRSTGVTWSGWPASTDKDAQNDYNTELIAISLGVRSDGEYWGGFTDRVPRPLTNAEMESLATAARLHVKDAFDRYWQVVGGINAGTITSTDEIDAVFA